MSANVRVRTAHHEAGHAVLAVALGAYVRLVSIIEDETTRGRTILVDAHEIEPWRHGVILCAGLIAEARVMRGRSYASLMLDGCEGDYAEVAQLASGFGALGDQLTKQWQATAQRMIKEHDHVIDHVARVLIDRDQLDRASLLVEWADAAMMSNRLHVWGMGARIRREMAS